MTHAEIQLIRSLDDKRSRQEAGLFVAEGEKLVRELLASGFRVRKVFLVGDVLAEKDLSDVEAERVSPKDMERASRLKTATDCLALAEIPHRAFNPEALRKKLVLALDGVQNPGNLGTIIRLADWFGIGDILCTGDGADTFNPKVVQATMGALTRVKVHYGDLAAMIPAIGGPVYGTFLEGENIYGTTLSEEGVIVLGSEGRGISTEISKLVTHKLFIPPFHNLQAQAGAGIATSESLNVAIAAAIVCSEFRRRQL